jgi:hypothetical protein
MQRQIWRENATGNLYAVVVERYEVIAATGPIRRSEIGRFMERGFLPDRDLTSRLAADYSGFRRYEW